jgi:putative secretion ATPase (PEP-CTERM system associated)
MYERFYNLRERPFALSPDPEYLFLSRAHSEALDSIRYGIESRAGFIVVTGEIGAGKTTLLQTVLQRLDDRTVIARVVNTMLEARELLDAIALDFGLTDVAKSKPVLLRDLGLFLVDQRRQGRRPLLVIDEAQNLSPQALEEVRLLSNLETEKSKLLQILLAGQPNLRDKIASPELEQFRQRIAVSYHLRPLADGETEAYINFRLKHAALGEPLRFPSDACNLIHEVTAGVPRLINVLCDAALVFGYAEERRTIDRGMIDEVIAELEETGIVRRPVAAAPSTASVPTPVPVPSVPLASAQPAGTALPATSPVVPPAATPAAPTTATTHVLPGVASSQPDTLPRPVAESLFPSRTPAASTPAVVAPASETIDTRLDRDRALAAARDAALQATQLASTREQLISEREGISRKQRDLAAKEQALLERERQIAEQRRIMSEEYRLLRQAPAARTGPAPAAGRAPAAPRPTPRPETRPARELTLWQRLYRMVAWGHVVRS